MRIIYSYDTNALRLIDATGQAIDSVPMNKAGRGFTAKRRLGVARHVWPKAFEQGGTYQELAQGAGYEA